MKKLLDFIVAGSEVKRYHTLRTIQEETVGHHSHMVALLCCVLTEPTPNLLFAALIHDLAEHQLGDIPSPAKREYGIGEQVNEMEQRLLEDVGLFTDGDLTKEEKRALKLADIFQGMIFCNSELQLGNKKMQLVLDRYKSYAEDMILVGIERELFNKIQER
jgi:5'-deoxynucleotidase YfbR-like HD superfamily hydrolase